MTAPTKAQPRRPLPLPLPTSAPPGPLEQVAWLLLHRVVPFQQVQGQLAARWGLPEPIPSAWLPRDTVPARKLAFLVRRADVRLQQLVDGCPPPASLVGAVQLVRDAPWLSELQLRTFLVLAGLSEGAAGSHLIRALAALWRLDATVLWPDDARQTQLRRLTQDVRAAGVVACPERLCAADASFLAEHGIAVRGHLAVRAEDATSLIARPIRRQLEAVGPLPLQVLIDGAIRECRAKELSQEQLSAWVSVQSDLAEQAGCVALRVSGRWLRPSDLPVLALFDRQPYVLRADILAALVAGGQRAESASVWVATCSWMRRAGVRGWYRRPMDPSLAGRSDAPDGDDHRKPHLSLSRGQQAVDDNDPTPGDPPRFTVGQAVSAAGAEKV